jgi:hypothetical protein
MGVGAVRRLDSDKSQSFEIEAESRSARLTEGRTTFMTVSHPDYKASQVVLGHGVFSVSRLDVARTRQ